MEKSNTICGLPWFSTKAEQKLCSDLGFIAILAVGPSSGRPVRLGWTGDLKQRMRKVQHGYWKPIEIHHIVWVQGEFAAVRLLEETFALLGKSGRRLLGDWFDITPEFAEQAIKIASKKAGVTISSHLSMIDAVTRERQRRIDDAVI